MTPESLIAVDVYLGQTAQNIIEVGKRLIQAKSLVAHGEWLNWLEKNFQLKDRMAQNFMACAERFGKTHLNADLNQTQMIEMLSLPDAEETEKFIAEKAAEGKRVDEMTIKQLREEIADYKAAIEQKDKTYQQSLFDLNEQKIRLSRYCSCRKSFGNSRPRCRFGHTRNRIAPASGSVSPPLHLLSFPSLWGKRF